ncbi:hypothetical protein WN55_03464 [Dufourea novaeangliae]|uniref:Uncharacterized protein n=1 Tax=Dufourea novaeangliae TaxID=178035 RepID=A0A154PL52_DUFNO|nr:hypothetical protein WN55_03464 [Dufourea novaeangliae]
MLAPRNTLFLNGRNLINHRTATLNPLFPVQSSIPFSSCSAPKRIHHRTQSDRIPETKHSEGECFEMDIRRWNSDVATSTPRRKKLDVGKLKSNPTLPIFPPLLVRLFHTRGTKHDFPPRASNWTDGGEPLWVDKSNTPVVVFVGVY